MQYLVGAVETGRLASQQADVSGSAPGCATWRVLDDPVASHAAES